VLVWQADTLSMNPAVDPQLVADAYAADDVAAAAEYGAQFRKDIESYVSREQIDAVTIPGRTELPPVRSAQYVAHLDAAGGSGADSMALAIAHAEQDRAVLDCVAEARPPFSPPRVAEEFAAIMRRYACARAQADRFGGDWVTDVFRKFGVAITPCARTRNELYAEFLPLVTAQRCELLDQKRLTAQLGNLERRTGRARDVIDHPPNQHDDVALVAAGACVAAVAPASTLSVYRFDV
jgi:hypothetical protein